MGKIIFIFLKIFLKKCAKLLAFLFWIWYSILAFDGSLAQLGEHLPYKQRVTGSNPVASTKKDSADCLCGNSSVVERHLAKVNVAGSNLVSRSKISVLFFIFFNRCQSRQRWRHIADIGALNIGHQQLVMVPTLAGFSDIGRIFSWHWLMCP